jgi:hypothetical protein
LGGARPLKRCRLARQVRIRTIPAPIHNHDQWTIRGLYGYKPSLPSGAGSEAVSVVDALGEHVTGIEVGKRAAVASVLGTWAPLIDHPSHKLRSQALRQTNGISDSSFHVTEAGDVFGLFHVQSFGRSSQWCCRPTFFGWMIFRTRSWHIFKYFLWRMFHGKSGITDPIIKGYLGEQSSLMLFRFVASMLKRTATLMT